MTGNSDDKGPFAADISQQIIDEALKSVERREKAVADLKGAGSVDAAGLQADLTAARAEVDTLKAQLEASMASGRDLMAKLKDEHERLLRAAADLENYKRRAQKEREELQKFGSEKLLKDFLPVYDNLDRALEHARGAADFESLRSGVQMTRKLFEDALGKHQVRTFSSKGQPFDPTRHEAMTSAESDELPPNHVLNEVLKGFTLNDRLVRPALVIVSRAKAEAAAPVEPSAPAGETNSPGTTTEGDNG